MVAQLSEKRLKMTLTDRLRQQKGWVYMTGMLALVRLLIQHRRRNIAAGHCNGGYVSGDGGSPFGRCDLGLMSAWAELKEDIVHFQPGVNEYLATAAAWDSHKVGLFPGAPDLERLAHQDSLSSQDRP